MIDFIHAITPGDHFSPSTGSAVPTVVDGLARAAALDERECAQGVLVSRGTYPDRYDSAAAIEYEFSGSPTRRQELVDLAGARTGQGRRNLRDSLRGVVREQATWGRSAILAHNLVELVPLIDPAIHVPVLYAHNQLLRTYDRRTAGRVLDRAAAVVCVSEFLAEQTARELPSRIADRVKVVRNGVDWKTFHPRIDHDQATAATRVVFVGRMIRDKGADVLIEAAGRLKRDDLHLTIIGSQGFDATAPLSSYERDLRRRASELRLSVDFIPFSPRQELPALLRTSDVLVAPSRWPEPWGLTIAEGMATGLAIIGSQIGGIPEVVGDAGLMVPPDDVEALAGALDSLTGDSHIKCSLSRAARQRAIRHDWSWSWNQLRAAVGPIS